jgi:glycosyltransferase involved in cell wall biosynthesis
VAQFSVVHLTNAITPDKLGGLERYVRELAEQLARDGLDVTVITKRVLTASPSREITPDGVVLLRHDVPSKSTKTFALRYPFVVGYGVLRDLRSVPRTSVVHCHYAFTTLPLLLTRRPYVYTFHAPVHKEILSERGGSYVLPVAVQRGAVRAVRMIEQLILRRARTIVVLSDAMAREVEALSPGSREKILKIPGGFDSDFFYPSDESRSAELSAPLRLFTARRLTVRTGVVELVEAVDALRQRGIDATLRVAGDGHQRHEIEQKIRELGLEGRVLLLGRISDEAVRDEYRAADLVVMPTQELEGFGLTTAEAMASGAVVVGTPIGANVEVIGEFNRDLVSADSSPQAIAAVIADACDNSTTLNQLRRTAAAYARDRWSWKAVAKAYEGLYGRR